MFDLISIGDCVINIFVPLEQAKVILDKESRQEMLSLPYGSKVPVDNTISVVGGNASNNAIGASRLGMKTAIYTNVGKRDDDEADHRIVEKLRKEKVDTRYVIENRNLPSNHHVVLTYKGERTILVNHQPWDFQLPDLDNTKFVYLTSLGPTFTKSNIMQQLTNYLERTGARLAFNPGTYQIRSGVKKYPRLLSRTALFVVNIEEAKKILGIEVGEEIAIKKLLTLIYDLGPRNVVITDGGEGSYGYDGKYFYKLGVFPAKLVEMTGTGDAFSTGTLAGIFHNKDLPEAMRWGAANSASVVEQIGPTAGLLTYKSLLQKLKEHPRIQAKEF
jgi:sugar/nucleoside kinase (ribokinase family)